MEAIMESKEYKDWRNFGIRVKNARNSIGMTTEQLAEKSNRSENYIFRVEAGQSCSIHTLYIFILYLTTLKFSSKFIILISKSK